MIAYFPAPPVHNPLPCLFYISMPITNDEHTHTNKHTHKQTHNLTHTHKLSLLCWYRDTDISVCVCICVGGFREDSADGGRLKVWGGGIYPNEREIKRIERESEGKREFRRRGEMSISIFLVQEYYY